MTNIERTPLLEQLENHLRRITRPIAFIGVLGMLVVSGITLLDVLLRWLTHRGITGLTDIVGMVFAVAVAACIPSGVAQGINLKIDILKRLFTGRLQAWMNVAGAGLLCLFFSLLTWQIFIYAASMADQGRTTPILLLPVAPFIYSVAVLLAVASIIQAVVFVNTLCRAQALGWKTSGATQTAPLPIRIIVIVFTIAILALVVFGVTNFSALAEWIKANTALTVIMAFLFMWILLLGMIPLAAVMGLIGLVGSAAYLKFGPGLSVLGTEISGFLTNSEVAVLPLFLMMGSFASVAGLSEDIYSLAHALLGRYRGGLAMATIGTCAGFGAVTGSSVAGTAILGRIAIPEMKQRGYSTELSTGCVAAGGTLGAIVPPSAPLVVFALLSEASIGKLFIAAIVPAVIATLLYILTVTVNVRVVPNAAPAKQSAAASELIAALRGSIGVIVLFLAVMGGMYLGIFTATEAAAVGAFGAFLFALFRGKLGSGRFWSVMGEVTAITAMIYGLIFGGLMFSFFVVISALPETALQFVSGLNIPHLAIIVLLMIIYLFLGCIMDSMAVMVITVPIVTPIILGMGYDLIWWGIVNLMVVETGLITPPFGMNVFVLKSLLGDDVPMSTIFRGVIPFVLSDFVRLAFIVFFPILALWLPSMMK